MSDVVKVVIVVGLIALLFHISGKEREECERKGGTVVRMMCIDKNAIID